MRFSVRVRASGRHMAQARRPRCRRARAAEACLVRSAAWLGAATGPPPVRPSRRPCCMACPWYERRPVRLRGSHRGPTLAHCSALRSSFSSAGNFEACLMQPTPRHGPAPGQRIPLRLTSSLSASMCSACSLASACTLRTSSALNCGRPGSSRWSTISLHSAAPLRPNDILRAALEVARLSELRAPRLRPRHRRLRGPHQQKRLQQRAGLFLSTRREGSLCAPLAAPHRAPAPAAASPTHRPRCVRWSAAVATHALGARLRLLRPTSEVMSSLTRLDSSESTHLLSRGCC